MHLLVQSFAVKVILEHRLNLGNTGRPADQDHLINLVLDKFAVGEHLFEGWEAPVKGRGAELLKLGPRQTQLEVLVLGK